MENKGIKMFERLKQEIKEEPSNSDAEDVVENEGITMFQSLKQEIKEEPSSDATEGAVENEEINMIESLKQEVKEEPYSYDAEDAVDKGINMIDSLKQEVKEEPSSGDDNDDEDDEDYEEDYEKIAANGNDCEAIILSNRERRERDNRTVFISNVSPKSDVSAFWKKFREFGIIESIRFRGPVNPNRTGTGIVPLHPKPTRKVVAILKTDPWKTDCYYLTYKDENSAEKALLMNGKKWDGNILRVNTVLRKEKPDKEKAVSLGNLPPTIEENELWELFEQCGRVKFVRIIRDRMTGLARGIGYIIFESVNEAVMAMDLNGTMIGNTRLHVQTYTPQPKKKRRDKRKWRGKGKLKRSSSGTSLNALLKKIKTEDSQTVKIGTDNSVNGWRRKNKKGIKERLRSHKQRGRPDANSQEKGKG